MSEKLKRCPFCGSTDIRECFGIFPELFCGECEATIYEYDIREDLIKLWNTRPIEDELNKRIAELEAERRWIPVSERLPELRVGHVDLVYTVYGEIHSAMYLGNGWTSLYRDFRSNEVTHWMPLPNPPEANL